MNEYPWLSIEEQTPEPQTLVEVKYECIFQGTFDPECKLSEWIMKDSAPRSATPVSWRCIRNEETDGDE